MAKRDRRIEVALLSLAPTTKRPTWHRAPTVNGQLRGVSVELALWLAQPKAPCIRDIALHVAFWQNSVANRLSGDSHRLGVRMKPQTWPYPVESLPPGEWREAVALVSDTHGRLVAAVSGFAPDRLDRPPGRGTKRSAIEFIHGIAEHNLYHGGQINILKRLAKLAGVK